MKNQLVLRNAMSAKAAFYGISSVFLCLYSSNFAELLGMSNSNLVFGAGVVFFNLAALTTIALLKGKLQTNTAKVLILLDILIVCAIFGSMAVQSLSFSTNGYIITGLMGCIISCLAYAQHYGLKYQIERNHMPFHELEIVQSDAA